MLASLVLLLALVAPPLDPAQQARYDRALQLYDSGATQAAAVELESLAADTLQARMVFEAGQVRFAAGHVAHAWQHFQAYLARRDISEDDRSIAESRAEKAAAAIRPIVVRVTPASAATKVIAVRLGEPPELARPELNAAIRDGVAELRLDPGPWELRIDAPGHQPLHHHLDVIEPGNIAMAVPLTLQPVAPPPVVTAPDLGAARRAELLRRARIDNIVGAVALPVGLAALGGFVASIALRQETRARFESLRRQAVACDVRDELLDLRAKASRETGAIIALGITAGAVLTTSAVLLVRGQRRMQRARIALDVRPGHAGLFLSGAF